MAETPPEMPGQFDDPCAAYIKLRDAYTALVSGESIAETEYLGNGTQRRTKFTIADLKRLEVLRDQAQEACAAKCGQPLRRRRFAITAGYRP